MNSYVHGFFSATMFWTQLLPNSPALRTPCHGTTGLGARQRRSPTGGAANGMPLKAVMEASLPGTPCTCPPETFTGPSIAALIGNAAHTNMVVTLLIVPRC